MTTMWSEYLENSSNKNIINYIDLPDTLCLCLKRNYKIKSRGESITVRKLKECNLRIDEVNKLIDSIFNWRFKKYKLKIKFPVRLDNIHYVKLYSLLLSEGNFRNTLSLNVPEDFFHDIFKESLVGLFGEQIKNMFYENKVNGFPITIAPEMLRYLLPIPFHIPRVILNDKEYSRVYLKIAFEAEGSPKINIKSHKKYISLSRNIDITQLISTNVKNNMEIGQRLYKLQIRNKFPTLYNRLNDFLPETLLGEKLLLEHHFGVVSTIDLECIQRNKTNFRRGEFSAKWRLNIYSDSVDKFINEIGFLSKKKDDICKEMRKIKSQRRKYFALDLMKAISKNRIFEIREFENRMKIFGYITPRKFVWSYCKKGIIKRIKRGVYFINS